MDGPPGHPRGADHEESLKSRVGRTKDFRALDPFPCAQHNRLLEIAAAAPNLRYGMPEG